VVVVMVIVVVVTAAAATVGLVTVLIPTGRVKGALCA